MSKRSLMLSTAAVALLTSAAFADTTIDSSKSEAYTTGALLNSSNTGQANAGNITIKSAGSVTVSAAQGALTVDSNNWILQQGTVNNKDTTSSSAIHVDLSADRDMTGTGSITTAAGTVLSNASGSTTITGIYLDTSSVTTVSGKNTGKIGIYLDSSGCTTSACTYTGAITLASSSTLSVNGDSSAAVQIGSAAVLKGDLTFAGSVAATASTTTNTPTAMYGLYSLGKINGNVILASTGSLAAYGDGAQAMVIAGSGVTGYIQIGGALTSSVMSDTSTTNPYYSKPNTTTNPQGSSAMNIGAGVGGGIAILGPTVSGSTTAVASVTMQGTGSAIKISPASAPTAAMEIGAYLPDTANPGFSFYNRGSVSATYTNYNKSTTAMEVDGYSDAAPTRFNGGFFNSGSFSSSVLTSGTGVSTSGIGATGINIGNYVQLQAYDGTHTKNTADQAAFVNSGAVASGGVISASVSGSRGGIATGLYIASTASVPSLINTGTIAASSVTTDAALTGNASGSSNPLVAYGIVDASGTLTSILNQGTISAIAGYQSTSGASVSALDNNTQSASAILLLGGASSASASGVTIRNYSSSSRAATITGNIVFGTGQNQVLDIQGNDPTKVASVSGNVQYGMNNGSAGDRLIVGNYATMTGQVTTLETVRGAGVQVDVGVHGILTLLNTTSSLNATTVTVANGATVNLGVNQSLTATGGVVAAQTVNFASGATLGVTYASFVPQTNHQFVLMTSDLGAMHIDQTTIDAFNNPTNRPYLLATATMCNTQVAGCTRPSTLPSTQDALIIDVLPKTATQLGITPGSLAVAAAKSETGAVTSLFEQANIALSADNELGAAFINGIHNAKEAENAYNSLAPSISGGTRAIAISITDQATGPVGARQRALRMYGKSGGGMTVWGQEFVQMIKDPGTGAYDPNTGFKTSPGFKDHGFGLAVGIDGGDAKYGYYGGAVTFYAGDVNELGRLAHENQQWYLLSFYSAWRGKGLFLDTKVDAGYGRVDGKRTLMLPITASQYYVRQANNKHAGALISGGVSTGGMFSYGAATLSPQLSLDGLYVREEGYTEHNPSTTTVGDGFDLKVNQTYAKSLRAFIGFDARYDLDLWDFFLQPELRGGYRYDFLNDPTKVKASFAYADVSSVVAKPGTTFTLTGPDPSQGNFVLGASVSATTDAWTLGFNFDFVKGSNGAFQQVGTLQLLGRI